MWGTQIVRIDISRPEGNTLQALGIATQILKKKTGDASAAIKLQRKVFSAGSAKEARDAITDATNGAVTFFDGSKQDA